MDIVSKTKCYHIATMSACLAPLANMRKSGASKEHKPTAPGISTRSLGQSKQNPVKCNILYLYNSLLVKWPALDITNDL